VARSARQPSAQRARSAATRLGPGPAWNSGKPTSERLIASGDVHLVVMPQVEPTRSSNSKDCFFSSSSVYGDAESYPTVETVRPRPVSPSGVTKLAAEHLRELYRANFGALTASLRLFTVDGPGQRPDMAFSRWSRLPCTETPSCCSGTETRLGTFPTSAMSSRRCARSARLLGPESPTSAADRGPRWRRSFVWSGRWWAGPWKHFDCRSSQGT